MGLVACGGHVSEALMPPTMAQYVLDALFTFWRSLAAGEIAFARPYSDCMPAMAFTQLAYDAPVRRQGMDNMKQLWERLQKAEAQMPEYPFLYDFLHRLDWPGKLWCRELLLTAAECNFTVLPQNILQELQDACRGSAPRKRSRTASTTCGPSPKRRAMASKDRCRSGTLFPHPAFWRTPTCARCKRTMPTNQVQVKCCRQQCSKPSPEQPIAPCHSVCSKTFSAMPLTATSARSGTCTLPPTRECSSTPRARSACITDG